MPLRQRTLDGPGRDRTCDLGIKSPLLYQLSYRPRSSSVRSHASSNCSMLRRCSSLNSNRATSCRASAGRRSRPPPRGARAAASAAGAGAAASEEAHLRGFHDQASVACARRPPIHSAKSGSTTDAPRAVALDVGGRREPLERACARSLLLRSSCVEHALARTASRRRRSPRAATSARSSKPRQCASNSGLELGERRGVRARPSPRASPVAPGSTSSQSRCASSIARCGCPFAAAISGFSASPTLRPRLAEARRRRTRRCRRPRAARAASARPGRRAAAPCPRTAARISPGSEPAKTNDATSPWNWMWLRRSASISFTFVTSWNSSSTISARKPPPSSSRSGRSSSACSAGSGSIAAGRAGASR